MIIKTFHEFYSYSNDISQLLQDLMEITHKTTSKKLISDYNLEGYPKEKQEKIVYNLADLALLSQGLLKGNSLTNFINRSVDLMETFQN